jgi:hypothetical protein
MLVRWFCTHSIEKFFHLVNWFCYYFCVDGCTLADTTSFPRDWNFSAKIILPEAWLQAGDNPNSAADVHLDISFLCILLCYFVVNSMFLSL